MGCCSGTVATNTALQEKESTEVKDTKEVMALHRSSSRSFHCQYLIEDKLGEGSFARVYSCRRACDGLEEDVDLAVKVTDFNQYREDSGRREKLAVNEAHILRLIGSQEHVCNMIDSLCSRRFHFIVLERCQLTLLQELEGMPELTERALVRVFRQMFRGVQCVHALGVLHRDIKPDNFLCSEPGGTVKLCDFGMAHVLHANATGIFGTAPFMCPEMVAGRSYGRPADAWSLGVTLYAIFIGSFPYTPQRHSVRLMRAAIASGVPRPSFEKAAPPGVWHSRQVLALLKDLLRREPSERPSVSEALEHAWFSLDALEEPEQQWPSLKAALDSAKKIGVFEKGSVSGQAKWRFFDTTDRALLENQRKYHCQDTFQDTFDFTLENAGSGDLSTMVPSTSLEALPTSARAQSKVTFDSPTASGGHAAASVGVLIAA